MTVNGGTCDDAGSSRGGPVFEQPTHIYLNPVARERTAEFEQFLSEVIVPALRAQRPDLDGRWHVLRPVDAEGADGPVATYAFIFDGGSIDDDWELDKLLPAHYGVEEAKRLVSGWMDTFVPRSQWLSSLAGDDAADPQVGWTFTTVR
jgi:hypothetical protein